MRIYLCIQGYGDPLEPVGYGSGADLIIVANDVEHAKTQLDDYGLKKKYWHPDLDDVPWSRNYFIKEIDTDTPTIIDTEGRAFIDFKDLSIQNAD